MNYFKLKNEKETVHLELISNSEIYFLEDSNSGYVYSILSYSHMLSNFTSKSLIYTELPINLSICIDISVSIHLY